MKLPGKVCTGFLVDNGNDARVSALMILRMGTASGTSDASVLNFGG
jgi:hypothetical protein